MKTAFAIFFTISLISPNQKVEKEKWFLLSQVKFENPESCPNKKVNFTLHLASGGSIYLNALSNVKIKIDTMSVFLISSGQDTIYYFKAIEFCDLWLPKEIKIGYGGNCDDYVMMSLCYDNAFHQMQGIREATSPEEDSLINNGELDLSKSENYINIDIRNVINTDTDEFTIIE